MAERTATNIDDLVADLIRRIKYFFLVIVSVYLGSLFLTLPGIVKAIIGKLMVIAILLQGAFWGSGIFEYWLERYKRQKKEEQDAAGLTTFTALGFIVRLVLWSIVLLLALDNLGIQVTALVAGLGVGGIAVALAVQNILGDLFASMSIVLDKPFVIGDFIIVDNFLGTVEHIGLTGRTSKNSAIFPSISKASITSKPRIMPSTWTFSRPSTWPSTAVFRKKESSSLIPPKRSSLAKKTAAPTPRRRKTNKSPIKNEPVAGENLADQRNHDSSTQYQLHQ